MTEHSPVQIPVVRLAYETVLGENAKFSFETYLGQDEAPEVYDKVMDKLVYMCNRQRAKAMLSGRKASLMQMQKELAQLRVDRADAERRVDEVVHKLALAEAYIQEVKDTAANHWEKSGRRGAYKPTTAEESVIRNAETSRNHVRDELTLAQKTVKDYGLQISAHEINIDFTEQEIAKFPDDA